MTMRQLVFPLSVWLTACWFGQGDQDPNADIPTDPDADHVMVSTSNAEHFVECALATPGCLSPALLGFWSCPGHDGYEVAVGEDGRLELLNHNGEHGIGCVACDASFELVSDQDNLADAWVKVDGKLAANGDTLNVSWRECGALDIAACRQSPGGRRTETCKR